MQTALRLLHSAIECFWIFGHDAQLADQPRWVFHFTPTSASWLNVVESFFSIITRRRIRRDVFKSVADLENAIGTYIRGHTIGPQNPSYGPNPPKPSSPGSADCLYLPNESVH